MKKWLNIYFGFHRKEANGLLVLIGLIGLIMLIPYIYSVVKQDDPITEIEEMAVLKLALAEKKRISVEEDVGRKFKYPHKRSNKLFAFNPNIIGQADWENLGLSPKQSAAILRYIKRGGRFRKKEDLQKMYTINTEMYNKLAPYINIIDGDLSNKGSQPKVYAPRVSEKRSAVVVEVNTADTTELDKIKGIGMTFANRIIKYRERIGGFHRKEQLMEVFGIDSVKYLEIKDQVLIDASRVKKININTAGFEDFKNHPYIRYKQVNALIQFRKQHGNYSNIADLNKVAILNQETIDRLTAYLEF
jgi:competence protein ComEA